jgi:hypothetical protein
MLTSHTEGVVHNEWDPMIVSNLKDYAVRFRSTTLKKLELWNLGTNEPWQVQECR